MREGFHQFIGKGAYRLLSFAFVVNFVMFFAIVIQTWHVLPNIFNLTVFASQSFAHRKTRQKCASKSLGFHSNRIFCVPKPPKKKNQLLNQNRYIRTDASKYDFWMHSGAILPSPKPEIGVATAHQPSECLVDHMSRFTTRTSLVPCYGGICMGESCQCIQFLHVTRKCSSKCITWRELF